MWNKNTFSLYTWTMETCFYFLNCIAKKITTESWVCYIYNTTESWFCCVIFIKFTYVGWFDKKEEKRWRSDEEMREEERRVWGIMKEEGKSERGREKDGCRKKGKGSNGQIDTTGNANSNFVVAITMTGKNTLNIH